MRTRVEIFKNNTWVELVLKEENIKYNLLSNKIGNFEQRRISHSNTFALPYVSENIVALDINVFSPTLMAESLNKKYAARYFVKDKLQQKGFLVINNTVRGEINVNFIDEALVITDEWGKRTFRELLLTLSTISLPNSVISTQFINVIVELSNYETDKTQQVLNAPSCICTGDDPSIEGKEIYIARYPNLLNSIGDKFNIDSHGVRKLDSFNPFQSRPIFSIFGFIYIICQAFGYRLRLDSSVDFELLRDTYLTSKGVEQGTPLVDSTVFSVTPTLLVGFPQFLFRNSIFSDEGRHYFFQYPNTPVTYDALGRKTGVQSLTPNEIGGGYNLTVPTATRVADVQNQKCIVKIESTFVGEVEWTGSFVGVPVGDLSIAIIEAKSVWKLPVPGPGSPYIVIEAPFVTTNVIISGQSFTITGDKAQLNNIPSGTTEFIGLRLRIATITDSSATHLVSTMKDFRFREKVVLNGSVSYDSYGQYLHNHTNLLSLAPDTPIKELLANVLQQQGLLLVFERDLQGVQNIVKLLTYGAYRSRVQEARAGELNKYYDWSIYHQKYIPPLWNTDYGAMYGEVNEVSLSNPFPGNVGRIQISTNITSQGFKTKLIPLAKNGTKSLKDVSLVNSIFNTETYFEYTLTEQGLVSCSFDQFLEGTRKQFNAEQDVSTINCAPLPKLSNVIYSDDFLPIGIKEWYYLVDVAVRCDATFLLPTLVLQTLDLSKPVYVESLGGFYIVEEIPEYTDDTTPVKVKLIKLPL